MIFNNLSFKYWLQPIRYGTPAAKAGHLDAIKWMDAQDKALKSAKDAAGRQPIDLAALDAQISDTDVVGCGCSASFQATPRTHANRQQIKVSLPL